MSCFGCTSSAASLALPPAPRPPPSDPDSWDAPDPLLAAYGAPSLIPPLHLVPTALLPAPRTRDPFTGGVLTPRQAALLEASLPRPARGLRWRRLYHLATHGASLTTLLRRSRGCAPTVLAVRTAAGATLGAFSPSPWWDAPPAPLGAHADTPPSASGSAFFGYGGGAFVWSFGAGEGAGEGGGGGAAAAAPPYADTPSFTVSAWRPGLPHQLQYLLVEPSKGGGVATRLGVGGGGERFALLLDEMLDRGLSGHCAAFDSPALGGEGEEGAFRAVGVELWGFGEEEPEKGAGEARGPSFITGEDARGECAGGAGAQCR